MTCQSANQLNTPAKVSWAFKMVSQFGSLSYTIMRKNADLTVGQKTIIDTLHKEGKPQTFIAKEAGCSQSAVSKHVNMLGYISYLAPKLWNSLPENVRGSDTLSLFKSRLKTHLFSQAFI